MSEKYLRIFRAVVWPLAFAIWGWVLFSYLAGGTCAIRKAQANPEAVNALAEERREDNSNIIGSFSAELKNVPPTPCEQRLGVVSELLQRASECLEGDCDAP